jgi:tetratricopeptide (TPR) repeat protein
VTAQGYSLREVCGLLGLSRSIVSSLTDAGFVAPERGRRNEYRFTFHDLIVLRAARGLVVAGLSSARILRSLRRLKAQLPEHVPIAGLRIEANGDAVVVSEGDRRWQPDDGQYVFGFTVAEKTGVISFIDAPAPATSVDDQWFEQAAALEASAPEDACAAYRRAIEADPASGPAYTNLGRLLHQLGRLSDSEAIYRQGLERCGPDATSLFNLGVLLQDANRDIEAADAYRAALAASPEMADAHYNLALVCEANGMRQEAIRHLNAYRKFVG